MTLEEYIQKYNDYIRGIIYKRADSDYRDDAYQEVVMRIIEYKDRLDSLDNDNARRGYICTIAKHAANPNLKKDKKLRTYEDFRKDNSDTSPEEYLLEDDTYCPDKKVDLTKRAWAEDILETKEVLDSITKTIRHIRNRISAPTKLFYERANKYKRRLQIKAWSEANPEKMRDYIRERRQRAPRI